MADPANGWTRFGEMIGAVARGASGVKLGPGVLATIAPVNIVGLLVICGLVFFLRGEAVVAALSVAAVLLFLIYVNERAYRYADKNPLPALLGGSQLLRLYRDQSARDKSIVSEDQTPVLGASSKLVENSGHE